MTTQLELERALCRELGINALDRDAVDYMLDRINERAFEAPVRPPRLIIEGFTDPRE